MSGETKPLCTRHNLEQRGLDNFPTLPREPSWKEGIR